MARKNSSDNGNDNYTMLIDIIINLTPKQARDLYQELKPRFTRKSRTKLYNVLGEIDTENGKIRLTEYQYKSLRTKYGDTYIHKAFQALDNRIRYYEQHLDEHSPYDGKSYKLKLREMNNRTHIKELEYGGNIYEYCKQYISAQAPELRVNFNPYLIEDVSVARKYIESLSLEMRKYPDVQFLVEKFPELMELVE